MKIAAAFALFALVVVSVSASERDDQDWQTYKLRYNKNYSTDREHKYRKAIFLKHRDHILTHNQRYEAGLESHKIAVNRFTDYGKDEFESYCNCLTISTDPLHHQSFSHTVPFNSTAHTLPKYVNWVEKGAVTDVKDQGNCGSCWTFSATGTIEGAHFLKTGKLVSLSEQNIIDCDQKFYDYQGGCNGGLMTQALDFVRLEGGIDTEESYPYLERTLERHPLRKCHYKESDSGATVKSTVRVRSNMEALMEAVATKGPISIAVYAHYGWMGYKSGVFKSPGCYSEGSPNHGVLLVGYGTDPTEGDYWLIKNSWGTGWGDKGYMKLARNYGEDCMITYMPAYPIV